MLFRKFTRRGKYALAPALTLPLAGCAKGSPWWIFDPKGVGAHASFIYMMIDVGVMLAIVGVTALLIVWFMWKYRKGSNRGAYDGKWAHSNTLEVAFWGIPIIAVGFLAWAVSVNGSFAVNPYNPTAVTKHLKPNGDPIDIDVIATDWQWLFIYPQYHHIAIANKLVIPAHTPVFFRLTSTAVTTDFFVPQLIGMIDVMPGMRTKDALMSDHLGSYQGIAADYCGAGMSWMLFKTHVVSKADFDRWTQMMENNPDTMSYQQFNRFAEPYINVHEKTPAWGRVEPGLFDHVMLEVMNGKKWPLPMFMTENMFHYLKIQAAEHRA
ncbi:ubiquinol oxidase subunit II [Acidithiobacillus sp. CV18-2]|uniref:Ubiquinol oxidase subunit II n=1 Tax=Igneacidithiobacillus copahuensis TaxID=2724909 RepID=A0AAE2YS46_9PROT|nr:ubiquinol oxidase subunit II [Igneacidithiobacillus copahuensis]MBU2755036.1 ubiquinol oxidase subunit II [Acidithiobacillus sp. CV18-3]MBU2758076.1 ubiquinol oxidase subunit II [Acidithiobacillus sp. BN09-2]MBU2777466.1 ubiquinol oxidase subunit II [Acidithiobacillus sp. CV18-2]MBU2796151.1 ubiquinol oxidase subunit II [Acidithiobacillus sp. VAN18-2]MBU2800552.1 ubiquinol oxidase subunit II [Acidithiobacillus sp. VAN18-4]UTV82128.1 ubiquinol oxidase subunit II [Acidithiobacillus sp. YTS05